MVEVKKFKMTITVGKDLPTRESITYITHALNQEDADNRLKKYIAKAPELKGKYVYALKAVPV